MDAEETDIPSLLSSDPFPVASDSFASEQGKDPQVQEIIHFLEREELPLEKNQARKIALQAHTFILEDGVLFYLDPKQKYTKDSCRPEPSPESDPGGKSSHYDGRPLLW